MSPAEDLRVLIVDDEGLARDFLRRTIADEPGVVVVGECGDGDAATATILKESPDLVFLDIRMPQGGGFDLIERVGAARMPEVIFVTAYEQYTLRAFEVHALDYVVKPYEPDRILDALRHARSRIGGGRGELHARLEALLDSLGGHPEGRPRAEPRRLTVRDGDGVRLVDVDDIEWLQADDGSVLVHAGRDEYRVAVALHRLLDHLGPRFVRIHRSAAVNIQHVTGVRPWAHGDHVAVLASGRKLRVSRSYRADILRLVH